MWYIKPPWQHLLLPAPFQFSLFTFLGPLLFVPTMAESDAETCPFRHARVVFAVDVFGSTAGTILRCEQQFVRWVLDRLSPLARNTALVAAWSDHLSILNTPS